MSHKNLTNVKDYTDFRNILHSDSFNNCECIFWIKVNGTFYKPKMIILVDKTEHKFTTIQYISKNNLCDIFSICKLLQTLRFCTHIYAYEVTESYLWSLVPQSTLNSYKAYNIHISVQGKSYVPVKP